MKTFTTKQSQPTPAAPTKFFDHPKTAKFFPDGSASFQGAGGQRSQSDLIALKPSNNVPVVRRKRSGIQGELMGWNRSNEEVKVKRTIGSASGYEHRVQAIAVARLAKIDPAAIVQDEDGKWHAVEPSVAIIGKLPRDSRRAMDAAGAEETPFLAVEGLPPASGIEKLQKEQAELKTKLAMFEQAEENFKWNPKVQGQLKEKKVEVIKELNKASRAFIAMVYGVPEAEINPTLNMAGRQAGKINILMEPLPSKAGTHGSTQLGGGFEEGQESAITIPVAEFEKPSWAQTVLFHEAQHLNDWELAQAWIKKYKTETGRIYVNGTPGLKPFEDWLTSQVKKKRITKAEKELVIDQTLDAAASLEARANLRAFSAALQAGQQHMASEALRLYAYGLRTGRYSPPRHDSEVKSSLIIELRTAYQEMPKTMKQQYAAAFAGAKKEYPAAWISELDFSRTK